MPIRAAARLGLLLALLLGAVVAPAATRDDVSAHLTDRLTDLRNGPATIAGVRRADRRAVLALHDLAGPAPLWTDGSLARADLDAVVAVLAAAGDHGLDPADFHAATLDRLRRNRSARTDPGRRANLDILLTDAVLGYIGRFAEPRPDAVSRLARLRRGTTEDPAAALARLAPDHADYRRLQRAYVELREIAHRGGWPRVGPGPLLRPGRRDPRVPALRNRLSLSTPETTDALLYDRALAAAVRHAQTRFGLAADGIVGPRTTAALDVPADARLAQMALNLQRWHRLPRIDGRRHVRVNVAAGLLDVIEADTVRASMRAIVGRPDRPTPTLTSRITAMVLNPAWNIPQKMARLDVLPHIRRDPAYLSVRDIRVFASWRTGAPQLDPAAIDWPSIDPEHLDYKLQQQPGPLNPLGRAKFLFANPYAVYIHDTPGRHRFDARERFFSSGCVRVEDPVRLAQELADDRVDVEALIASGETTSLSLPRPVPLRLLYLTAWVDAGGAWNFRPDPYGLDAPLPGADGPGVDVDEGRSGIVADAADALP